MSKNSTLIYFVKNFQSDFESIFSEEVEQDDETYLAEMAGKGKSPSDHTIANILSFARSYEVIKTEKAGLVEMNLN